MNKYDVLDYSKKRSLGHYSVHKQTILKDAKFSMYSCKRNPNLPIWNWQYQIFFYPSHHIDPYRQFTTPPPLKIANIIYGLLSGNYVNFDARVETFGCLKSLGNSASSEPIKLQNSGKNPARTHAKKSLVFRNSVK